MLDLAIFVRGPLHRCKARSDVPDLFALVANSLEVGNRLDDRDNDTQIAGGGRAGRKDPAAFLVDGDFHVVDLVVVHGNGLTQRAVAFDERRHGLVKLLLHEAAHPQHWAANPLQVFVEAAGDVVTEIRCFHQLASPGLGWLRPPLPIIAEPGAGSAARAPAGIGSSPSRNCSVAASQVKALARSAQTCRFSSKAERIAAARSSFRTPVTPGSMTSFGPGTGNAATGTPHASASIIASPNVSVRLGNTNTSAALSMAASSSPNR